MKSPHSRKKQSDQQQGFTICSNWNSYILSIKLRTKSNIDIVQKINNVYLSLFDRTINHIFYLLRKRKKHVLHCRQSKELLYV